MNDRHETRRLFFALWPSDELRVALAAQTSQAVQMLKCRPVPANNLHVTLAFLGAISATRIDEVIDIGHSLSLTSCRLSFDRLVTWNSARVLALLASETPESLVEFVRVLQMRLNAAEFHIDDKPHRPHITLARDVHAAGSEKAIAAITWPVNEFVLVESIQAAHGSHYEMRARFP